MCKFTKVIYQLCVNYALGIPKSIPLTKMGTGIFWQKQTLTVHSDRFVSIALATIIQLRPDLALALVFLSLIFRISTKPRRWLVSQFLVSCAEFSRPSPYFWPSTTEHPKSTYPTIDSASQDTNSIARSVDKEVQPLHPFCFSAIFWRFFFFHNYREIS